MDDKPIFKGRGPGVPSAFTGEEVVSEETIKELARRINGGHTMENKQTAVEWLVKMLHSPVCVGFIQGRKQIPHHIIEQAKQMEKEQIIKAGNECQIYNDGWVYEDGEQYYNETYGK